MLSREEEEGTGLRRVPRPGGREGQRHGLVGVAGRCPANPPASEAWVDGLVHLMSDLWR